MSPLGNRFEIVELAEATAAVLLWFAMKFALRLLARGTETTRRTKGDRSVAIELID